MSFNPEPNGADGLTAAILAYFDKGSPIAFLPAGRPDEMRFVGLRDGEIAYGDAPLGGSPDQTNRVIRKLHGFGITTTEVCHEIPTALQAAATDTWLSRDNREWERLWPWFRIHCPYAFVQLRNGAWLAINRKYKPLGVASDEWVDYEDFAADACHFICNPAQIRGVWASTDRDNCLYLYGDDPKTRRNYFTRLYKVMNHALLPGEAAPPLYGN